MRNIKLYFIALFFSFAVIPAIAQKNEVINIVNGIYKGQFYCSENTPQASIAFIKQILPNIIDYCPYTLISNEEKSDFNNLKVLANKEPKKYAFYLGYAYELGVGTDINDKKAVEWLQKAIALKDDRALMIYSTGLMQGISPKCDNNLEQCLNTAKAKLVKLNTAQAYDALTNMTSNTQQKCDYAKKAVKLGSLNSYPLYVACEAPDGINIANDMKHKLNEVIDSSKVSIPSKVQAAKLLRDTYKYGLLSQVSHG